MFLAGCAYVGYVNELLKNTIPPLHRAILMIGFILGTGAASRWIMVLDIKRNMAKIKRTGQIENQPPTLAASYLNPASGMVEFVHAA